MRYNIHEIAILIGARQYGDTPSVIEWLLTDSRSLTFPETTLFFALESPMRSGNTFIPTLYNQGVRNFVVNHLTDNVRVACPDANFLVTTDTLKALQRLAERHRERFSIPVISITGSNGKTIVKEWMSWILQPHYRVTRSPKSYNSQIGVPLSAWLIEPSTQIAVLEAGISQPGEMEKLKDIIQPTMGIITNIGEAHQENFKSMEEKCMEKLSLFTDSSALVYPCDDSLIRSCIDRMEYKGQHLSWSMKGAKAWLQISHITQEAGTTRFDYITDTRKGCLRIPFTDEASIQNAASCLAAALYLQTEESVLQEKFSSLERIAMRLEVRQGINDCTIINDSYNSDYNSLDIALDFMSRQWGESSKGHLTLLLSDMLQTGVDERKLYRQIARLAAGKGISRIIAVGEAIGRNMDLFPMPHTHFATTELLLASGIIKKLSHEIVLIKGARPFGFDHVAELLEMKAHQTILEVNLNHLVNNVNRYRSFMSPHTRMICMVKASAYGTGAVEVSRTLQDHKVDYLAVAVADEGVTLRREGITAGIIVMNPETTAFKEIFDYRLEPEIYSFSMLNAIIKAATKEGITHWPVHIKLDTGMHRLGFDPTHDMEELIRLLKSQSAVTPRSVFSHFVGSDNPAFDDFTHYQFALFDKASLQLQEAFPHHILRHICNSAGIERFPQYHLDMVRLGLGLYGINPIDNGTFCPVATLKSVILQIHEVDASDTVGYSRKGTLGRKSRIAALPIGYADGLNRHLGCRNAYCLVHGKKAPYVGNICMDVCMIDVTDIECLEGDEVEIFGPGLSPSILADIIGTIPYEIMTSVSERVCRVYCKE